MKKAILISILLSTTISAFSLPTLSPTGSIVAKAASVATGAGLITLAITADSWFPGHWNSWNCYQGDSMECCLNGNCQQNSNLCAQPSIAYCHSPAGCNYTATRYGTYGTPASAKVATQAVTAFFGSVLIALPGLIQIRQFTQMTLGVVVEHAPNLVVTGGTK